MPYKLMKLKNNKYRVINKITGKVHAKSTTLKKAEKQIRLMQWLDHRKN
jgi:hypothetical protein